MRRTTTRSSSARRATRTRTASATPSSCTSAQLAPYLNGSKNLTFSRNAYRVPSLSYTRYFIWSSYTDWNEWQALGHDLDGSISQ